LTHSANAAGLADGDLARVIDAFDKRGYNTAARAKGYAGGGLLQTPPAHAAVSGFGDYILAEPTNSIADTAEYRDFIIRVAEALAKASADAAAAAVATTTKGTTTATGDSDETSAMGAYADLRRLNNSTVILSNRCCFVGEARTNVTKFGYINKVPELLQVKLYGSSGNGKRKLGGLEGATLELDEAKPKTVNTIQAAHGLTKDVVYGMCAALSKVLLKTAVSSAPRLRHACRRGAASDASPWRIVRDVSCSRGTRPPPGAPSLTRAAPSASAVWWP
jgi:hypothetical protein